LISGIFREKQLFFKWYGGFYRKALDTFEHFFVQNSHSKELLLQLGKSNVTVSGDTRFDRVVSILERDNTLNFITIQKQQQQLLLEVLGQKMKVFG
jgi:3-deoxy-D-manno-octulosonic-acid transferase